MVQGNIIGLNQAGTTALGNGADGIAVSTTPARNTLGGTTTGAGNIIAASGQFGILLNSVPAPSSRATSSAPTRPALRPRQCAGRRRLVGTVGTAPFGNTIGGTGAGAGNVISGNGRFGVFLERRH